jgi:hypothetical protein
MTGNILSFFDFIHEDGMQLGIGASPIVTLGYLSLVNIYLTVA